jgi:Undecaprenyl-phosphate glucose phosphotransferase
LIAIEAALKFRWPVSDVTVSQTVRLMDVVAFGLTSAVVFSIYLGDSFQTPWHYCAAVAAAVMLMVSFFQRFGLYDFETIVSWPRKSLTLSLLMGAVLVIMAALAFALKVSENFSRVWVFSTFAFSTMTILVLRGYFLLLLRRWALAGRFQRRFAIVGAGEQAKQLLTYLTGENAPWRTIVGVFDDRLSRTEPQICGHRVIGNLDDLFTHVRKGFIDSVIIALPWYADDRVIGIVQRLRELPVHVYLGSDLISYRFPAHHREMLSSIPVLKVASAPLSGWGAIIKLLEDKILSSILLVLVSPVMLACVIAIKLDSSGPVIFRQKRYGFNNEEIIVFKFRTMYHDDSEEKLFKQATRNDPRITRVGRFLRRTSLDELPQLLNVWQGTMSLVGPRPHPVALNEKFDALISGYSARHNVKPGITGWAQVNGFRGETDVIEKMKLRIEHDIFYIENWSVLFDLRILAMTGLVAWMQKTAY